MHGGQQHLRVDVHQRLLQCLGDDVAGLVDIAQAVGFVQNHQIPFDGLDVIGLGLGELVRADDGACCALERVAAVLLAKGVVALGLQQNTLQVELVLQFLRASEEVHVYVCFVGD